MLSRLVHALRVVRTYLAECKDREEWGDPLTGELTEVIHSCIGCIGVKRRGAEQDGELVEEEALRHAIGYLDERSTHAHQNDMASGRA